MLVACYIYNLHSLIGGALISVAILSVIQKDIPLCKARTVRLRENSLLGYKVVAYPFNYYRQDFFF